MRVENCERGVEFAGAEPREIWLSTNQSLSIPPGREPKVAERGCSITARYVGLTGGVAEHLMTPEAGGQLGMKSAAPEQESKPRRLHRSTPPKAGTGRRLWTAMPLDATT
jgi:hypothetical protein